MVGRTLVAVGALVLVAVAVTAAAMWALGGRTGHGPIVIPKRVAISMSAAVPLNKPYSYSGPFIVRNESDHTMVLDAAELVQVDPGISYLGAYAQEPSKYKTTIGVGEGYKGGQLRASGLPRTHSCTSCSG